MIWVNLAKTDTIPAFWPVVAPMLQKAVNYCHGETTIDYIYEELMADDKRLLLVHDDGKIIAAVVVSINEFPNKKICQVSFAGGESMDKWCNQGFPVIREMAKAAGADAIYIQGRKGWLRQLKDEGFKEYATVMGVELN